MPNDNTGNAPENRNTLAIIRGIVSGGLAGALEVLINHPLWQLKTRYQDPKIPAGQKFFRDFKTPYRGIGANMASMIPITALQVGSATGIKAALSSAQEEPLSGTQNLSAACAGGAIGASVSGPTELVMSHQQKGRGFIATAYALIRKNGLRVLAAGMPGTAIRDAIFTGGYLFGKPYLRDKMKDNLPKEGAEVGSALTAGVIAGGLSQFLDTVKTRQQTDPALSMGKGAPSFYMAARNIYRTDGFKGFYKGGVFRTARVISAVGVIGAVTEAVDTRLKNR